MANHPPNPPTFNPDSDRSHAVSDPNDEEDYDNKTDSDDSGLISIPLPSKIFRDRTVSVLEAIVEYMKDDLDLTFHDIAKLLNRDDRTVWTCYSRTKKKRAAK
ncbi:MAG: hypothetical protein KKE20_02970 [Nanoarchaeota archaeon]|nr:hypothetical protein [Nanoarchaeota archaeon]